LSKQLFTLEFPVKNTISPSIVFEFLQTPAGLQEWFADRVDENHNLYAFSWDGNVEKAELLELQPDNFVRFRWLKSPKEEYFEFRIERSKTNNGLKLVIKDFADAKDISDQRMLWEHQVKDLFHRLGN
jgi:uncharacterized protein YndB with AHSA1/START domain